MKGKIVMITGANSGIGKATALGLAKEQATIIMVCRDKKRGEKAQMEIKEKSHNNNIDLFIADLSSQEQIRRLIKEFIAKYNRLDVLINNAGIMLKKRALSVDHIEMNLAVNYLAPFLLTNLLLEVLKMSIPSRIINVSAGLHKRAILDIDDLQNEKDYSIIGAYSRSKVALILFSYELSRRLEGSGITVNVLHPGVIRTNLLRDIPNIAQLFIKRFLKSPEKGAETSIYLASSPEVAGITGKYFKNKKPVKSSDQTYDDVLAKKLWDISEKLTNIKNK